MAGLVSTLGVSPGVPYETLLNLCRGSYDAPYNPPLKVDSVTIVYTTHPMVVSSYMVAWLLIECGGEIFRGSSKSLPEGCGRVTVDGVKLPFEDVDSRERFQHLAYRLRRIIGRNDVVDVTGGRASMAIAASLAAAEAGAMIVTTLISPQLYNQVSSAFDTLIKRHPIDKILREIMEAGSCSPLNNYPETKELLGRLVTGTAKTFVLHP